MVKTTHQKHLSLTLAKGEVLAQYRQIVNMQATRKSYTGGGGGTSISVICWMRDAADVTLEFHHNIVGHFEKFAALADYWNPHVHVIYRDRDGKMIHPKMP